MLVGELRVAAAAIIVVGAVGLIAIDIVAIRRILRIEQVEPPRAGEAALRTVFDAVVTASLRAVGLRRGPPRLHEAHVG